MRSSDKGSIVLDPTGTITFASSFFCALVRLEAKKIAGKSFFDFVFPEDVESARARFEASKLPQAEPFALKLRRANGTGVWTAIEGQPLQTTSGELFGISAKVRLAPILREKLRMRPWPGRRPGSDSSSY
jgi:PAS domain S-box-containing protein